MKSVFNPKSALSPCCVLIFALILASPVCGQDFFWSGAGGSSWSNVENWQNGQVPSGSAATNLFFTDNSNQTVTIQDIANPFVAGNMSIDSVNDEYDMRGGQIVIEGGTLEVKGSQSTFMTNDLLLANDAQIILEHTGSFNEFVYRGSTMAQEGQTGGIVNVEGSGRIAFEDLTSLPAHLVIGQGVSTRFSTGSQTVQVANGFDSDGDVTLGFTNLNFGSGANINGALFVNGGATIAAPSSAAITVNDITFVNGESSLDIADNTTLNGSGDFIQDDFSFSSLGSNSVIDKNVTIGLFSVMTGASATSTITGSVNLQGGELDGILNINSGMQVDNQEDSFIRDGSTISVHGTSLVSSGRLVVNENALLTGEGNALVLQGSSIDLQFGTVQKQLTVNDGGFLTGNGEVIGDIDMMGIIAPGNSAGTLTVDGDIDMDDTTVTCVELGGSMEGEYDLIREGGDPGIFGNHTAFLDGELIVTLIDDFTPDATDDFMFIRGFNIDGEFNNTGLDSFAGGSSIDIGSGTFLIEYGSNFVRLYGYQAAVPEPGTGLVLACCGIAYFAQRRRRCS